jgi:trans-aconitate 2-methyltransferase
MPWDPEKYNQFRNIRFQPFFDLVELISPEGMINCADLGCGTGEQTRILSEKFSQAQFTGIDASAEMLAKSRELESANLHFRQGTVEAFVGASTAGQWDLVFSNAALQWSDEHAVLFPQLITLLSSRGQLAVQMPVQKENLLNQLLAELVSEEPFAGYLNGWKRASPVLSMDEYAQLMFEHGLKDIQLMQKVYPIIADDEEKLFDFISGSALIPYMERMTPKEQESFVAAYRERIRKAFRFPAIYAFKRVLLYGRK